MSLVKSFAPHLPFLRRYARALTGSQESGDAYIRASLQALAENPEAVEDTEDSRLSLYRFFHVIWGTTGAQLEGERSGQADPADKRLQALAPIQRQAFLLTALEGFTAAEASKILGITEEEHRLLEQEAQREIEDELATKVLIIEDEPIIAADLESLVEDLGHTVTGIATTHREALRLFGANPPGLVLCDIQLADGSSGIDAAHDILADHDVPIIFITAFPERLLTGERPEPTYLIPKPFQENTVKAAIGQALFFHPATGARIDA
ncbi:MAG: response regulator [Alphaproteobacteria bacterium]|nr:response regulator [Alphaproteobacteria bacterium]|tara:strand:- start:7583 stop:8377 length:795 start_codon:yes stop_codon:yes gene_type:complete